MRTKATVLSAMLFAALASAQTSAVPDTSKTFDFTNKPSQQGLHEIATVLRTVGDINHLSIDPAATTLTIQGTPDELAMSGWIIHELDQPPSPPPSSSPQYLVAGKSDDVVRVFHLAHISAAPQAMQEILTVLRTVADIQKIFNYTPLSGLVVRGPAAQIALARYIIDSLDVAPGSMTSSQEFHYTSPPPNRGPEVVRVFYLKNSATPQATQEILTTLRTVADIQKIFNYTPLSALTVRGSVSDIATTEWLIQSLDISPDAKARPAGPREFNIPGNISEPSSVVKVYYPAQIADKELQQTLGVVRTNLRIAKAFYKTAPPALIFRGSADQIAKADLLIQESDKPALTPAPAPSAR